MKVKISTHTLIVQASKLNCIWQHLEEDFGEHRRHNSRFEDDLRDIVKTLPNIEAVDFSAFAEYFREDHQHEEDFEIYFERFLSGADEDVIDITLKNMLEVIPDGEILLDLNIEDFLTLRYLLKNYIRDPDYMKEHRDPKYNTFTLVEE